MEREFRTIPFSGASAGYGAQRRPALIARGGARRLWRLAWLAAGWMAARRRLIRDAEVVRRLLFRDRVEGMRVNLHERLRDVYRARWLRKSTDAER